MKVGDYEIALEKYLPLYLYLSCYSLILKRKEKCSHCKKQMIPGQKAYYVEGDRKKLKKPPPGIYFKGLLRCSNCKDLERRVKCKEEICYLCNRRMLKWVEIKEYKICYTCDNTGKASKLRKQICEKDKTKYFRPDK